MAEITLESVNEKLAKNEALTPEETTFVMSLPPSQGAESNITHKEEEEIDWEHAEDLDAEGQKKEETPEEKKAREDKEATVAKKKQELIARAKAANLPETATEEEITAAETKKKQDDESTLIDFAAIERELAKPEGQEDLKDWPKKQASYFYTLRNAKKAQKRAEEERDAVLFREIQRKEEDKAREGIEAPEEDPLAALRKRDPEDFLTAQEVIEIFDKVAKKAPAKKEGKPPEGPDPFRFRALKAWDEEARTAHPDDYDAVMELHDELILKNTEALISINNAMAQGENPAEAAYKLIKQHPDFEKLFPAAKVKVDALKKPPASEPKTKTPEEIKKENEAAAAQAALEQNQGKSKTTGHTAGEGSASEGDTIDGYSINDIIKMSPLTFSKLPKATREKFLRKYG